jgi:hypothetical protein
MKNTKLLRKLKKELDPIFKEYFQDTRIRIDDYTQLGSNPFLEIIIDDNDTIAVINPIFLHNILKVEETKIGFEMNRDNEVCYSNIYLNCKSSDIADRIIKSFSYYLKNREEIEYEEEF